MQEINKLNRQIKEINQFNFSNSDVFQDERMLLFKFNTKNQIANLFSFFFVFLRAMFEFWKLLNKRKGQYINFKHLQSTIIGKCAIFKESKNVLIERWRHRDRERKKKKKNQTPDTTTAFLILDELIILYDLLGACLAPKHFTKVNRWFSFVLFIS